MTVPYVPGRKHNAILCGENSAIGFLGPIVKNIFLAILFISFTSIESSNIIQFALNGFDALLLLDDSIFIVSLFQV